MTIHLDTEIVATSFDPLAQTGSYTIQRDDKRWTATVPISEFNKLGVNKVAKRNLVATALNNAMQGPSDT